jgi:flagellar biogenesis protein FliO
MSMVGFITLCLLTYKKLCQPNIKSNNGECLYVENALRLNPKKQIYIVRAGEERFLVASDAETTTMLAKLDSNSDISIANSNQNLSPVANITTQNSNINNLRERISFKFTNKEKNKIKA